jgi:predicted nucleotidyltransferase
MNPTITEIGKKMKPVLMKYGIASASVSGSYATGKQTDRSDIDLIVEFDLPIGLLTFARIKRELEEVLGRKVDLIERSALKPRIRKYLLINEIPIAL